MLQSSSQNQADPSEAVELQQIAVEFRQETRHREAFAAHCRWYYETAARHQAELAAMENDIPLFRFFWRSKK